MTIRYIVRHKVVNVDRIPKKYRDINWNRLMEDILKTKEELRKEAERGKPLAGATIQEIPGVVFWVEIEEE